MGCRRTCRTLLTQEAQTGQQPLLTHSKGVTDSRPQRRLITREVVSAPGTSRHFATTEQSSRLRGEPDIQQPRLQNRIY
jgi:hypothetical protein